MASTRRLAYGTYGARRAGGGLGSALLGGSVLGKVAVSLVAVGTTAAVAGLGTYANFTDTSTPADLPVSSGTVTVEVGSETQTNRLAVSATLVAPGDTIQRAFTLQNDGTLDLASVTLTTTATATSLLDTDATNGLQLVIDRCSVPWTEGGSAPAYTYTCGGTTSSVLASRAVIGSDLALSSLSPVLTAGGEANLRATLTLPASAGNTFQGITSTVRFVFTGTQRALTDR